MRVGKRQLSMVVCAVATALWGLEAGAAGPAVLTDVSGSVGYTFRAIEGSRTSDATSHQLRTSINTQGYLWEPWFATVFAGLRATQDSTDYSAADTSSRTTIIGAELDLNVLPQSRAPFSLSYRVSDSRVDTFSLPSPLTTLGRYDFETTRLALRQTYFTEMGDRIQARFDHGTWESSGIEDYKDHLIGLEYSMRRPRHTLSARTSYQETGLGTIDNDTEIKLVNLEHFFHPDRDLRFDTMVSYYDSEATSTQPMNSTNLPNSQMSYLQASNFVFWRPTDQPYSVSAGIRIFDMSAENAGREIDQASVSAMAGGFYQYTKNLRLDANLEYTDNASAEMRSSSRQRLGALYQSDLRELFSHFTYNWHAQASIQNQDIGEEDMLTGQLRLGHDAQRMWMTEASGTFRLALSQTVSGVHQTSDQFEDVTTQRLDHTGSASWDLHGESGTTMVHLTLSDSRGFGDQEDNQQFANVQFMRNQTLTLYSVLSGNLTIQMVSRDFNGLRDNDTVTATGQVTYRHMGLFDIARLRFNSDLRVARAATDEGVDRHEWENRLDYAIGLMDASLSWRYISFSGEQSDDTYNIIYFSVNRRF